MTHQNRLPSDGTAPESSLITLDQEARAPVGQANDINAKINLLEGSLDALQSELDTISQAVTEGLAQLSDSDLDLTSKVADTYRRLGDIESTYQAMTVISENIDSEVKKLTEEVTDVATRSAADLEDQNTQFARQHEQLAVRMKDLVSHSQQTSARLSRGVKENTQALLRLEQELSAEIDSLVDTTNERSANIDKALESGRARMLQLQAVDEALAKRAASLENSAAELTRKSGELSDTVNLLDQRTDQLSDMVARLQESSEKHGSLIKALQDKSIEMALSLKALAGTENRHFKMLSGFLVIAVLAIAGLYFHHQSAMRQDAVLTAARTQVVDQHLSGLQRKDIESAVELSELQGNLVALNAALQNDLVALSVDVQDSLVALNAKLEDQVATLNQRLQAADDRALSLDGRISSLSPFSRIGASNVIHGPQWLARQPAENYAVQIATVTQQNELYAIAQRYNRYLTDELAYYTRASGGRLYYVLLSGSYPAERAATAARERLPRFIKAERPVVTRLDEVQKRL